MVEKIFNPPQQNGAEPFSTQHNTEQSTSMASHPPRSYTNKPTRAPHTRNSSPLQAQTHIHPISAHTSTYTNKNYTYPRTNSGSQVNSDVEASGRQKNQATSTETDEKQQTERDTLQREERKHKNDEDKQSDEQEQATHHSRDANNPT